MNDLLKKKVDLMVENYYELKSAFKWEAGLVHHFGAMINSTRERTVDKDKIEEIKRYIKLETKWSSYFRGVNSYIIANILCFEENYKQFFQNMLEVYDYMKTIGFKNSHYLPLAAYTLVKEVPRDQWNYRIKRMKAFYDSMKRNHFWLTSYDDYVFAVVLATTNLDVEETSQKIERCYSILNKEGFYKGNDLQTLSHILALGEEDVEEKCMKAIKLNQALSNKDCKLKYNGLAILGVLTLMTTDIDKMAYEIKEVYEYLYEKDGYGLWSLDKSMRTVLSASLVSDFYVEGIKSGILQVTLGNSINAIIIAQQQAAIAAACAASAAAAASSSSS